MCIREGLAAAFRGPLEIYSVSDSMPGDIFGLQSSSSPFFPQTGQTSLQSWVGGWFGGGATMQTSHLPSNLQGSASFNSEQCGEQQTYVQNVVLDPILTTSEVILTVGNGCAFTNFVSSAASSLQNYPKISAG